VAQLAPPAPAPVSPAAGVDAVALQQQIEDDIHTQPAAKSVISTMVGIGIGEGRHRSWRFRIWICGAALSDYEIVRIAGGRHQPGLPPAVRRGVLTALVSSESYRV
jgi:hypothetical protein